MAFKDLFKKEVKEKSEIDFNYSPIINSDVDLTKRLSEQFKGEVEKKDVKFPKELGEEHPFDFKELEELYKKFGFFTAVVDKYIDFVVGPGFYIECEDERAKKLIEDFMRDVNFDTLLRAWTKEALIKGNGFLEIGGDKVEGVKGLKVLNANYMYAIRDKFGKVLGYNQYKGAFDRFAKEKVVKFSVDNIAHFPFNVVGDSTYGIGIGYSTLKDVNNFLQQQKDVHHIMTRKANSLLHAQLGKVDGSVKILPKPEDVTAFGQKMETMTNKTEWATDPLVNFKVIDFGNIGEKFASTLEHDLGMLFYIYQIPPELMGMANIPEGMAQVRIDAFQRRVQSIQAEMEKIVEQQIFKRVLNANGFDVHVEFEWGVASTIAVEGRMKLISEMIRSPMLSNIFKDMLEKEMVNLLKLDLDEYEEAKAEEGEEREREEERPVPIVPGQNLGFPQKPLPKEEQPPQPKPEEIFKPIIDKLVELEEKRSKWMQEQEQKRNEFILNQEKKREEERLAEEKEKDKVKEEQKVKVEIPVKVEKKSKLKKIIHKKVGLLPPFRITRKTEAVESIKEPKLEEVEVNEYIRKVGSKWCIFSHKTGKKLGTYDSEEEAKKALQRMAMFKHMKHNYEYQKSCPHCTEAFEDINDIEEWLGFSYKKYLSQIHNALMVYDFNQIMALTEAEMNAGYLSSGQVEDLRKILDNGFEKGLGMREMAKQVDNKLKLKDLYRMTDEGEIKTGVSGLPILSKSAEKRSIGIVRSEVTRLANQGAVDYYKENDVNRVTWIASFGARTCPDCEALNGQIFDIGNHPDIPLHPMCRCTLAPFVELK